MNSMAHNSKLAEASANDNNNNNNDTKSDQKNADSSFHKSITNSNDELTKDTNFITEYFQFKTKLVWRNVLVMSFLHVSLVYALYLTLSGQAKLKTLLFAYALAVLTTFGITGGAHRLWSHRSYKATWQLRLILMILDSMSFQNSIYEWVRDHRLHHKHTETDADPHNAARGFFFSHMGWLMVKKHPDVRTKGATIDLSDLERDPIVMFQKRNYSWMMPLFSFALPTLLTYYVTGDSLSNAWYIGGIFRYMFSVHGTWTVNSLAHYYGSKPYDKNIAATNCTYVGFGLGEGWHNYHHVFPWDYKTSELGDYGVNWTCAFIDFFAKIGWAYDLKTVPDDLIRRRAERTGDGKPYKYTKCLKQSDEVEQQQQQLVVHNHHHSDDNFVWGWDDEAMDKYDKENAIILNKDKSS